MHILIHRFSSGVEQPLLTFALGLELLGAIVLCCSQSVSSCVLDRLRKRFRYVAALRHRFGEARALPHLAGAPIHDELANAHTVRSPQTGPGSSQGTFGVFLALPTTSPTFPALVSANVRHASPERLCTMLQALKQ